MYQVPESEFAKERSMNGKVERKEDTRAEIPKQNQLPPKEKREERERKNNH